METNTDLNEYNSAESSESNEYHYQESEPETEPEMEPVSEREEKSSNTGKYIIMGLLTALLGGASFGAYTFYTENENLAVAQQQQQLRLDSLSLQATNVIRELDSTKTVIGSLQSDNANVQSLFETANREIEKKKREIGRLQGKLSNTSEFEAKLAEAQSLTDTLNSQIQSLTQELDQVKAENATLKQTIASLEEDKKSLNTKIQSSTGFKAHTIKAEGMTKKKGDNYEMTDRAKRTNRISVSFELTENKLAPAGKRNIHLLIISPKGEVLGAGEEKFSVVGAGKESAFTRAKEVDYPTDEKIFFNWDDTKEYAAGMYQLEIYCDGVPVGKSQLKMN